MKSELPITCAKIPKATAISCTVAGRCVCLVMTCYGDQASADTAQKLTPVEHTHTTIIIITLTPIDMKPVAMLVKE